MTQIARPADTVLTPLTALQPLAAELDRMLSVAFTDRRGAAFAPLTDLVEDEQAYTVTVDLPGVAPEAVDVTVEDGTLHICGERARPEPQAAEGSADVPVRRIVERLHGRFARRLRLPGRVDPDAVTAHMQDGVLTVRVPKASEARSRRISIETGG